MKSTISHHILIVGITLLVGPATVTCSSSAQNTTSQSGNQLSNITPKTNIANTTMDVQLDPQAQALLNRIAVSSGSTFSMAGLPEIISKVEYRKIPGPGGDIPVRIYTPLLSKKLPVLVYFHGGGFTSGNLKTHDTTLRALANKAGCIIVSVAYRLAPQHKFPAAPNDAYAATKWVAAHAQEIGADARRIAVGGDSAGANLATVVALMARDRLGPALVYQVLLYPNTDATMSSASWTKFDGYVLTKEDGASTYAQYLPSGADKKNPYISPLWAKNLKSLPPALVITAGFDPLHDEGQAYAQKLKQAGVPVVATDYKQMIHGFFLMAGVLDQGKKAINQTALALQKVFAK